MITDQEIEDMLGAAQDLTALAAAEAAVRERLGTMRAMPPTDFDTGRMNPGRLAFKMILRLDQQVAAHHRRITGVV